MPLAALLLMFAGAESASAAVAVSRAQLSGSSLRLEGTATANRDITVDGAVMGRSDGSGKFRIDRNPFTPPADCTVDVNDGSATARSATVSGCTVAPSPPPLDTTAPTVPAGLAATVAGSVVNLSWTASSDDVGVIGYRVSRNGTALPGTVAGTAFADSGLPTGTHTYTVAAVDAAGNVSGASNSASVTVAFVPPPPTDTTAPTVPANLTATVVGTTISLNWDLSTDDTAVTGYRVTRNGTVLGTTDGTTFINSGLAAGTYTYTVAAFDGAGNTSGASNSVAGTVETTALTFVTPSQLPDATVGQPYLGYIVASDPPGPSTFSFKVVSGSVPSGTTFVKNTLPNRPEARVFGTPSRAGAFSFTVEVQDNTGARVRRTFNVTVLPR